MATVDIVTKLWTNLYVGLDRVVRSFQENEVPTAPVMLATTTGQTTINLSIITPSAVVGHAPVHGYKFYTDALVPVSSNTIDVAGVGNTYTVTGLTESTVYSYVAKGLSVDNVLSGSSAVVSATTQSVSQPAHTLVPGIIPDQSINPGQSFTPFNLNLFFTDSWAHTLTFTMSGTHPPTMAADLTTGDVTFTGPESTIAVYTVIATADDGYIATIPLPAQVTGLSAPAQFAAYVTLTWSNIDYESGYYVERSLNNSTWTQIGSTTTDVVSYTDATVSATTLYYYRVRAFNSTGSGPYSSTVSLTTPASSGGPSAFDGLALTLTGGAAGKAWTFGHAFKQADAQSYISCANLGQVNGPTSFQADVRNRWSDGSVKYAVLSGIGGTSVALSATGSAPASGSVALVDPQASVQFSGVISDLITLASVSGTDKTTWTSRTGGGLVRTIAGPVMTERHYYAPTSDPHLAVWWYVRSYVGGATEVETVIENGWLNVATPTAKTYTAVVSVSGSPRYTATNLTHYHHSRWSRVDWVGTDPAITPTHDTTYLRSTLLVPNYGNFGTATDFAYTTTATPFTTGNWRTDWNGTGDGDKDPIGLLPPWEALYCTTGNVAAYDATVANARLAGGLPAHFRDEATGKALRFSQCPTKWLQDSSVPPPSGGQLVDINPGYDGVSHGAAMGYFAYLLTGRWAFMEESQFWATENYLYLSPTYRSNASGLYWGGQARSVAWGLRQLALAATLTPDSEATLKAEFTASFDANIEYMYTNSIAGGSNYNLLGVICPPRSDADSATGNAYLDQPSWQYDFITSVIGWSYDLAFSVTPHLTEVRDFGYKFIVERLGTTTYNWRRFMQYRIPFGTPESNPVYYTTWSDVYLALKTRDGLSDIPYTTGLSVLEGALNIEAYRWTFSYAGQGLAACVYAVDHGYPGASTGYSFLTGSSSYALTTAFANSPKWGIVSR
jgi:hypothetical protein